MGVCAPDDRKTLPNKETLAGIPIRVSQKTNHHHHDDDNHHPNSPITPLDHENPNKKMKLLHEIPPLNDVVEEEEEEEPEEDEEDPEEPEEEEDEPEEEEEEEGDAEPIGDVVSVTDHGGHKRSHFCGFRFDGNDFHLEDTVLVAPEEGKVKPSVAVIKDIFQTESGSLMVSGRRFYRPEEAEKKEGGTWEARDARELFFSSYLDELDSLTVMHKCVIHLVPFGKTLPDRKQQPGFIVQKFYDFRTKKVRNLIEKDCSIMSQAGAA